jgi:amidohydrolase
MSMKTNDISEMIRELAGSVRESCIEIRRDIHAHPETGFDVERTAGVVSKELTALGIDHQTAVGQSGVVGFIKGGRPGPTLLLRADMDALPIHEQTGLPFSSVVPGKMHACGHDLHTATLIGVAAVLQKLAPHLSGNIRLMFQPAEETPQSGARAMIDDGVLDGVSFALGFHNHPDEPTGTFSFIDGMANGSCDEFEISVRGQSGHAAHPDQAVDPIVAAANLIVALQTIVSREVNPMHPAVITVGGIQGGGAHNIIAGSCDLMGTVRCQSPQARTLIDAAIHRQCKALEALYRVKCDINYMRNLPSLHHDKVVLDTTRNAIARYFGDKVVRQRPPSLGAEDFSLVGAVVPSFQLGIGSQLPGRQDSLHNSDYQPDEESIHLGVVALSLAAVDLLSQGAGNLL